MTVYCPICVDSVEIDDAGNSAACRDHRCTQCGSRKSITVQMASVPGKDECRLCVKCWRDE
jgi:hypothetical protein